jgi:hypothetical protein
MIVTIIDKEKSKIYKNCFIVKFYYLNNIRSSLVTPKVLKFLKVSDLQINQKIKVFKSIKNNKEFYKIVRVIKNE